MKFSSIFRSRWMALLWSAGIIWFALDVASDGQQPSNAAAAAPTVDADQARALAAIIEAP